MKNLKYFVFIFFLCVFPKSVFAQEISISIDKIETNERILGFVSGLPKEEFSNFKVIVYVHTDKWYIHPYAGQGEGLSWATIQENGTWFIETVKRKFKADKIVAVLVKLKYQEPNTVENIYSEIPYKSIALKNLKGTEHYGKL